MEKKSFFQKYWLVMLCGLLIGAAAVLLSAFGNPANMGFCIACFLRDIAGSLKLHQAGVVQYFRPEIVGIIVGACLMALIGKEFKPKAGSSPVIRFTLGAAVMVGALVFLGCPLRMVIRIGGGDLNAVIGLVGFILGILIGTFFLKKNFSLGRAYKQGKVEGLAFPVMLVFGFVLTLIGAVYFAASAEGPGSKHAPILLSLGIGLIVGALAQKSRLCMVGGVRDAVLFKEFGLLAGFGCVLLGGCPLRQLVLSGEGNTDSAMTVIGLMAGAAFAHNFGLASSGEGPTANGKIAVILGIAVVCAIACLNTFRKKDA